MPRINLEIWLTDNELKNFKKEFQGVLNDPDTVYADEEFFDWIGEKLLDKWRRKPIKES